MTVRDAPTRQTLTRLLLHTTVSAADTTTALQHLDDALRDPTLTGQVEDRSGRSADPPDNTASTAAEEFGHALIHMRRWVLVLDGSEPVPQQPDPGPVRLGAALVPTAMQLFLRARCAEALEMVREAQRARLAPGHRCGGTA